MVIILFTVLLSLLLSQLCYCNSKESNLQLELFLRVKISDHITSFIHNPQSNLFRAETIEDLFSFFMIRSLATALSICLIWSPCTQLLGPCAHHQTQACSIPKAKLCHTINVHVLIGAHLFGICCLLSRDTESKVILKTALKILFLFGKNWTGSSLSLFGVSVN